MRVRLRGPSGQISANFDADATIQDLLRTITDQLGIRNPEIKIGYPPQILDLSQETHDTALSQLSPKLDGSQLTVVERPSAADTATSGSSNPASNQPTSSASMQQATSTLNAADLGLSDPENSKENMDIPEIPLPSHGGLLLLRVMPDDNSCLFRAFGSAFFGLMDNVTELRSIIAQTIQANQDEFSAAVLGKEVDKYCRWIQKENSWGGAIELLILARHFEIEICSIDVQTLRVDHFNEGMPKRCFLVYSGIHYDVMALAQPGGDPEMDVKIFDAFDDDVSAAAQALCLGLQSQNYYTDTAGFQVLCNTCGATFRGEKGATEHAKQTGHYDFGETAKP